MTPFGTCDQGIEAFTPSTYPVQAATGVNTDALTLKAAMVAQRDRPAPWLEDALGALEALRVVGEDWDSYGAAAVAPGAIEPATDVCKYLASFVSICPPVVTATPAGEVGFCWDTGGWSLDVSVDRTGLISYVFLDEQDPGNDQEGRTRYLTELMPFLTRW